METVETAVSRDSNRDDILQQLWVALVRWLRRRVRCEATANDIAAETVSRAWRRFFTTLLQKLCRLRGVTCGLGVCVSRGTSWSTSRVANGARGSPTALT